MSVKNLLAGEGGWACIKEVLGWIIDTKAGTVALPDRKIQKLRNLLAIPTTQRRMSRNNLERLIGKLRSMHLALPGAVANLYHLQRALAHGWGEGGVGLVSLPSFSAKLRAGGRWRIRQPLNPPT